MKDRPCHRSRRPLARLYAARRGKRSSDRNAYLEIKDVWNHPQMMGEPRPRSSDTLRRKGCPHLHQPWPHHVAHLRTRNGEMNKCCELSGSLGNLRSVDHGGPPIDSTFNLHTK